MSNVKTSDETANAYASLGLPPGAPLWKVKICYRRLVKRWHPDKFATSSPETRVVAEERTKEINEAYFYLKQTANSPKAVQTPPSTNPDLRNVKREETLLVFAIRFALGFAAGVCLLFEWLPNSVFAWVALPLVAGFCAGWFGDRFLSVARRLIIWQP